EARMKVEQSLMAVLEDTGARMVLVSEKPETTSTLDQLAEAILVLHQRVIDDRRVRELEFRKLRGVPIRQERYLFTLAGGRLRYLEPFAFTLPERTSMFRPLENTSTHMSTGSRDIDALLGGGVPRGSTVLLEIRGDVPFEGQIYVPLTALLNFLATVASRAAGSKDIQSIVARPNLQLTQKVANISQIHLVLSQRWGTLILYGVKPRTGFYALQFTFGHGYPEFELIPLEDISLTSEVGPEKERPPSVTFPGRRHEVRADFFETVMTSLTRSKKGAA